MKTADTVTLTADMENNADTFWDNFRESMPELASRFASETVVEVDRKTWAKIQLIPGFCEGPSYAREALIETQ